MNNTKWIFFDLGWTLVDETESHRARLQEVRQLLAGFGHDLAVDDLMTFCELAATEFVPSPFRGMLSRLGLTDEQREQILDNVRYDHAHEVLYPSVPVLLKEISERFKLGVIANQAEGTEQRLLRWSIRERFSLIFASAELGLSKPDSRIFEFALRQTGCEAEEAIMVGDRLDYDIGPAKAQGWRAIRVLQGFSRLQQPRTPEEEPDRTIATIAELSGILMERQQPTTACTG